MIIFCSTGSTSASPSGGLPAPRASISAFLSVELTMRRVETTRSFLAFCASFKALLMSSRSTVFSRKNAHSGSCLPIHNTQLRRGLRDSYKYLNHLDHGAVQACQSIH